jgi:hypothetical protein
MLVDGMYSGDRRPFSSTVRHVLLLDYLVVDKSGTLAPSLVPSQPALAAWGHAEGLRLKALLDIF